METAGLSVTSLLCGPYHGNSRFIRDFLTVWSLPWKQQFYQLLPYCVAITVKMFSQSPDYICAVLLFFAFSFSNSMQLLLSCTHKERFQFHNACKVLESVSGWFTGDKLFQGIVHQGIISSVDKFNFCIDLYTVENVTCRCLNKGLILKGLSLSGWS